MSGLEPLSDRQCAIPESFDRTTSRPGRHSAFLPTLQAAVGNAAVCALIRQRAAVRAIQRVVTRTWAVNPWRSSVAPAREFATRQEAEAFETQQAPPAAAPAAPAALVAAAEPEEAEEEEEESEDAWNIRPSARTHYNDGWGAKYGIRNDPQLRAHVSDYGDTDAGEQEIHLGQYTVGAQIMRGCNILYRNQWAGNTCTSRVYHCGPTAGAG